MIEGDIGENNSFLNCDLKPSMIILLMCNFYPFHRRWNDLNFVTSETTV